MAKDHTFSVFSRLSRPILGDVEHRVKSESIARRPVSRRPEHMPEERPTLREAQKKPPVLPSPEIVGIPEVVSLDFLQGRVDMSLDAGLASADVFPVRDDEEAEGEEDGQA